MKRGICLVVFGALFLMPQGNASADEQSLNDRCRAEIRAQIKGQVCQRSQADYGDPCFISPRQARQFGVQERIARCVDQGTIRRRQVALSNGFRRSLTK
jgi:hypothetical protein